MDPLLEIAVIFVTASVLAYISKLIKQPIIPAYILAGLVLVLTGFIEANSLVDTISTLGIAFLLFLVGLEINFSRIILGCSCGLFFFMAVALIILKF